MTDLELLLLMIRLGCIYMIVTFFHSFQETTGDIGEWLQNGNLAIIDRKKKLVMGSIIL